MGNSVLVIAPETLDQLLWCHGLLRQLKVQTPQVEIDLLAPERYQALVTLMPEVSNFIVRPVPAGQWRPEVRWQLAQHLRPRGYRQAYVCPDDLPSALVPWLAGIPLRTGWLGSMRYFLLNDPRRLDSRRLTVSQRFAALAAEVTALQPESPLPQLVVTSSQREALLKELGLRPERLVALCPQPASQEWPEEWVTETALLLLETGWQVVYLGSDEDAEVIASELDGERSAGFCVLGGTDTLWQQALLLSACQVVCGDAVGPMLLAASLGVDCLACSDRVAELLSPFAQAGSATEVSGMSSASGNDGRPGSRRTYNNLTPSQLVDHLQRAWC